ncbi:MAG: transcriptional repressor [Deltaproteobacteria bacterium]|nr:transcriptional repressor [Deltaproteobacteria bacterium]
MEQEQGREILRRLRLKVTPRRLEVMRCLGEEQAYLSAEEVWNRIRPVLGSIGLPTVYRILDELAEAQVVTRIFRSDRTQYYFLCPNQEHHHHFICESCRRVEDVDRCNLDGVAGEIARRSGGLVTSHILQINGVCGECSRLGEGGRGRDAA